MNLAIGVRDDGVDVHRCSCSPGYLRSLTTDMNGTEIVSVNFLFSVVFFSVAKVCKTFCSSSCMSYASRNDDDNDDEEKTGFCGTNVSLI